MTEAAEKQISLWENWTPMTAQERKEFVLGWCDGKFWTDRDTEQQFLTAVFMPLAFWNPVDSDLEDIALIYEHLDRRGQRSINGMPMFMSVQLVHKHDWAKLIKPIQKELARRDRIGETVLDKARRLLHV